LIKGFQPALRTKILEINSWPEKLEEVGGIGSRRIEYDLGHRRVKEMEVFLGHDDVLSLAVMLMEERKFREILTARFPILFIDEYQDTNVGIAESIVKHFVAPKKGPLIGLFGDSWQKIYGDGCGLIEHEKLYFIGKGANFRSVKTIVDVLNRMRSELPQEVKNPESVGFVEVYHTNNWAGTRRTGPHWAGDLPADDAHAYLLAIIEKLEGKGWDFSPEKTKILMLTHNVLANEQGYSELANVFSYNESYIKKESPHIAFLVDTIEPICIAYLGRRYGEMFATQGRRTIAVKSIKDKLAWARDMDRLIELRENGSIGEILDHLIAVGRPRIPESVNNVETALLNASPEEINESRTLSEIKELREVPYKQVISLAKYLNDYTPFSTKHGVKGAEFENVLVVLGRGWNHYNWNQFLEWAPSRFPANKAVFYERNRNLFYVVCSRPKERLALLFTQELSERALSTLIDWFGSTAICSTTIGNL
ncbi:UvrD-helicase domain-containing protein, partial [Candidatus Latescibacterota bacterium]